MASYFAKRSCNAAAGYVLMRYSNEKDVNSPNWLPIIELIDFEISKLAYKALYDESWPNYLDLRNNDSNMIERSKENQSFHNNAEKIFNKLPLSIREKSNYKIFCSMTKKFFNDRGLTRIMYLNAPTSYYPLSFLVCILLKLILLTNVHDT